MMAFPRHAEPIGSFGLTPLTVLNSLRIDAYTLQSCCLAANARNELTRAWKVQLVT